MKPSAWARVSLELARLHQEQRRELDDAHDRLRQRLQVVALDEGERDESEDGDEPADG
ncbi:MAG TPA: hypothetical protein VHE30_01515 [Polyangiaceae bacterium]|nr:hypothetical protein [Polyangiaceae bacterium]